jgi:putative transposase
VPKNTNPALPPLRGFEISDSARSTNSAAKIVNGSTFRNRVEAMGITEVVSAPRSPWQNAFVERVIGSIRRECLDHMVIFNERHLRRVLSSYVDYHQRTRTHLSLDKDCPDPRPLMSPWIGRVVAIPQVSGLHHRYERLAG